MNARWKGLCVLCPVWFLISCQQPHATPERNLQTAVVKDGALGKQATIDNLLEHTSPPPGFHKDEIIADMGILSPDSVEIRSGDNEFLLVSGCRQGECDTKGYVVLDGNMKAVLMGSQTALSCRDEVRSPCSDNPILILGNINLNDNEFLLISNYISDLCTETHERCILLTIIP